MKKTLILLSLLLLLGFVNAQEKTSKPPCFRVSSFSSSIGFSGAMTTSTESDYYDLKNAAEDPGLFVDIEGFSHSGNGWNAGGMHFNGFDNYGYSTGGSGNGSVLFNLGLTPYSKKLGKYRDNRELRISVGSNVGTRNSFMYYDNNSFVIDTFQSVNGNGVIYADSSIRHDYYYSLDFTEINLGLSYLFKTDVSRRAHFYAGIGFNYGIAIRSTVNFNHNVNKSVYYYDENDKPADDYSFHFGNGFGGYYYSDTYKTIKLKSPMQFVRAYLPLGFSLRLSNNKTSFFNHVSLYTELNPGIEFQMLSSEKTYINPYVGAGVVGFIYRW